MKMNTGSGYGIYSDFAYFRTKLKTRDCLSLVFPHDYKSELKYSFIANGLIIKSGAYVFMP
jgi:hypothetical protein